VIGSRRGDLAQKAPMPPSSRNSETVALFRPVGPEELSLIERAGFRAFPPRLPEQPIFYPVLSEEYAAKIAREWNVPASGAGYVTRFRVRRDFVARYQIRNAGGEQFQEYWIPADELAEFNRNIVGTIEIVRRFPNERGKAD
jgi:hypothetical protein